MNDLEKDKVILFLEDLKKELNFRLFLSSFSTTEKIFWVESITLIEILFPKCKKKSFIHRMLQNLKFRKERRK